jgi:hypothetical protein
MVLWAATEGVDQHLAHMTNDGSNTAESQWRKQGIPQFPAAKSLANGRDQEPQ